MQNETQNTTEAQEQKIAKSASGEHAKKAWAECAALALKLGGGAKALWAKMRPDRSPEGMLAAMNESQAANRKRLDEVKPGLDKVYGEIVAKKKEYQGASPVRQRLLKVELQTLMAKYKGLEREFAILNENICSIEQVKGRFLEVLAHGLRGKLDANLIEDLTDDIEDKAEEAEDLQETLAGLERAGKRKERGDDDFDAELSLFDGELGLSGEKDAPSKVNTEATTDPAKSLDDELAAFDVSDPA